MRALSDAATEGATGDERLFEPPDALKGYYFNRN